MENNNLKDIWKSEIEKSVKHYSDKELEDMVIKSAKKSMKAIQPNAILRIVIASTTLFLIWSIIFGNNTSNINILYFSALLIIVVSYFLIEHSAHKLNQHKMDVSIKEWLQQCINAIEKSLKFKVKYDFLIYGSSFLLGYLFYFIFQMLRGAHFDWISIIIFISMFIYISIRRHFEMKNYNKTLIKLKELYKQLEDAL